MKYTSFSLLLLIWLLTACGDKQKKISIAPPEVEKAIFYQINVRDFSPEGTFKSILPRLTEIKTLGVNTLVLAPIHPIGLKNRSGNLGSRYASSDFKAIHPDLGTTADFSEFLDSCHAHGLYVLLEWNTTTAAADHPWLQSHPQWFATDSGYFPVNQTADQSLLNTANDSLQAELGQILSFWVESYGIDGYYVPSADVLPESWWQNTVADLKKIKPLLMLAHADKQKLQQAGFDLLADTGFYVELAQLFAQTGQQNAAETARGPVFTALDNRFHYICQPGARSEVEMPVQRYSNRKAAMIACLFNVLLPGKPFLVAGEEVGHALPLLPHEKNNILWSANPDIRTFYSSLLQLRATEPAFSGPDFSIDSLQLPEVQLIRRGQGLNSLFALINPGDSLANVPIPAALQGKRFTDIFTGRSVLLEKELLMLDYSFYLLKEDATS